MGAPQLLQLLGPACAGIAPCPAGPSCAGAGGAIVPHSSHLVFAATGILQFGQTLRNLLALSINLSAEPSKPANAPSNTFG